MLIHRSSGRFRKNATDSSPAPDKPLTVLDLKLIMRELGGQSRSPGNDVQSGKACILKPTEFRLTFIVWKKHEINGFSQEFQDSQDQKNLFSRCPPQTLHGR